MASTLTEPKIQNISTIVTLTNAEKSEKNSNDVRSDLDLRTISPSTIPSLYGTLAPSPPTETNEENQEEEDAISNDNSNSVEE
jgi:hypothetical protein